MMKTVFEIRDIAQGRRAGMLRELTRRELEVLLFELNRTQYPLKEKEAFIQFYIAVTEAIRDFGFAKNIPIDGQDLSES